MCCHNDGDISLWSRVNIGRLFRLTFTLAQSSAAQLQRERVRVKEREHREKDSGVRM